MRVPDVPKLASGTKMLRIQKGDLLLIPCSGGKVPGGSPHNERSLLSALTPSRAESLQAARTALREKTQVDERALMPAYLRYSGQLYENSRESIRAALASGIAIGIISGGYGLLAAEEGIGMYGMRFSLSDWPQGLLEACILEYAQQFGARTVIAVMASSTDYGKLIRRVPWDRAGIGASLVSPVSDGGGAMVKVPRAQGQAVVALVSGGLDDGWRSSDGLAVTVEEFGAPRP